MKGDLAYFVEGEKLTIRIRMKEEQQSNIEALVKQIEMSVSEYISEYVNVGLGVLLRDRKISFDDRIDFKERLVKLEGEEVESRVYLTSITFINQTELLYILAMILNVIEVSPKDIADHSPLRSFIVQHMSK